jgi:hypothetical protein
MKLNNEGDHSGSRKRLRRTMVFSLIVVLSIVVGLLFWKNIIESGNQSSSNQQGGTAIALSGQQIRLHQRFRLLRTILYQLHWQTFPVSFLSGEIRL